jgi:hypothetical protein
MAVVGVVTMAMVAAPREARGQSWSVDVSTGRINYPAATEDLGTAHLMGAVQYELAPWAGLYGATAFPLRAGDPFWTNGGGSGRWQPAPLRWRRAVAGVDVGADGFVFRDRLLPASGSGGSLEALPFVRLPAGRHHVEARAGWRGQTLSYLDSRSRRGVFETGARLIADSAWPVEIDTRLVHADDTSYPFIGGAVSGGGRVQIRLEAGKWLSDVVSDTTWGLRVTAPVGPRSRLWAGVRQDAPVPLYWNAARRSWSVGVTQRMGAARRPGLAEPARAGTVVIRVPVSDAPGGALSIAGDFTRWQPTPMRREGDAWVLRVPLAAGVYSYAFRSASGQWFVPTSIGTRRSDGFGGYVAILVVS